MDKLGINLPWLIAQLLNFILVLVLLRVDRAWDSVRDDPRFAAAVKRVGIP